MTAPHPPEEELAAYAGACPPGRTVAASRSTFAAVITAARSPAAYEGIVNVLQQHDAPATLLEAARERLTQRVRLRRFVDRFLSDPTWHSEVVRDPQAALERFRIQPTPELVAALKTLEGPIEVYGKELDERISKLVQGF